MPKKPKSPVPAPPSRRKAEVKDEMKEITRTEFAQLLEQISQNMKDRRSLEQRLDQMVRDVGEYEEELEKLESEARELAAQFDAAWTHMKEANLL